MVDVVTGLVLDYTVTSLYCQSCAYACTRYGGTEVRKYGGTEVRRYGGTEVRRYAGTPVRRYGGTEVRRYGGSEVRRYGGTEVWRYGGTEVRRYGHGRLRAMESRPQSPHRLQYNLQWFVWGDGSLRCEAMVAVH